MQAKEIVPCARSVMTTPRPLAAALKEAQETWWIALAMLVMLVTEYLAHCARTRPRPGSWIIVLTSTKATSNTRFAREEKQWIGVTFQISPHAPTASRPTEQYFQQEMQPYPNRSLLANSLPLWSRQRWPPRLWMLRSPKMSAVRVLPALLRPRAAHVTELSPCWPCLVCSSAPLQV